MAWSGRAPQPAMHVVHARAVMTLDEALERVGRMIGAALDWTVLESFLPDDAGPAVPPVGAGLELRRGARTGAAGPARARAGRGRSRRSRLKARLMDELMRAHRSDPVRRRRAADASTRSPSMSARATSKSRSASWRRIMRGAGSSWSSAAGAGISRPRPISRICCAARARSRAACRARRSRRWRSSPITSRSAAPRSRRSAASRSPRARSTC